MQFSFGKDQEGNAVMLAQLGEQVDPLKLLRAIKQAFPDLWQQVSMEIILPTTNGARNRIAGLEDANG